MQTEQPLAASVPWTPRDVWLGLGIMGAWLAVATGVALAAYRLSWNLDPGVAVNLWELTLLGPAWWLTVRKYKVGWRALGLRGFDGQTLGLGCGLMALALAFNFVYSALLALFDLQMEVDWVAIFEATSSPGLLLAGGSIVAPIVEEIFFRGFVFSGLRPRYGWQKAALISSAVFAVAHFQPAAIVPIFILGFIFAYLYHRSNSVWPAILMHVLTNALGLIAAYTLARTDLPGF
jgi:membrane protease YdiL (CAAX protease family)